MRSPLPTFVPAANLTFVRDFFFGCRMLHAMSEDDKRNPGTGESDRLAAIIIAVQEALRDQRAASSSVSRSEAMAEALIHATRHTRK